MRKDSTVNTRPFQVPQGHRLSRHLVPRPSAGLRASASLVGYSLLPFQTQMVRGGEGASRQENNPPLEGTTLH